MREEERAAGRGPVAPRSNEPALSLQFLPGVGPRRAELLERLGLRTVADLLQHLPRRYEDRRKLRRIRDAVVGEAQVLYGEIATVRTRSLRGSRSILEVRLVEVGDDAGSPGILEGLRSGPGGIDLVWFNQSYLADWLRPGIRLHAFGQVRLRQGALQMLSPEFEVDATGEELSEDASPHVKRIVPIYSLTKGLHQRFLRGLIYRVLERDLDLGSGPADLLEPGGPGHLEAYRLLHFPRSWQDIERARARFIFEEFFCFASHLFFRRRGFREGSGRSFNVTEELDRKIRSIFPFTFTREQDRVVAEIVQDLRGPRTMYRLLQGDVGTGKTAVALYAMLVGVRNGCQSALMAPTEILAEQHHRTVSKYLERYPVRIGLLTGSVTGNARKALLESLESGKTHIVVGTHALVQESVRFKNLGLAVIDEQHRFGVRERMRLRRKGSQPHLLIMTATPIPRSLCLTSYGDLDLSVLRERPEGRQPVRTILIGPRDRSKAMAILRGELSRGRQAYFVYPLIEESETLALPAARKAHEHLQKAFPEYRVGLVHGKLSSAAKDAELSRFRAGEYRILVATVVVEVGIDVPNASVLFIEDASRFGLAQLHQLRGRVGRGGHPGYCLVGVDSTSRDVRARLQAFAATADGFRIAEEDLKLRGPGDYTGVRQSGRPHFLVGNPLESLSEFLRVKAVADAFWSRPESAAYRQRWSEMLEETAPSEVEEGEGFLGLD